MRDDASARCSGATPAGVRNDECAVGAPTASHGDGTRHPLSVVVLSGAFHGVWPGAWNPRSRRRNERGSNVRSASGVARTPSFANDLSWTLRGVYHALCNLERSPEERLRKGLLRGRLRAD